MNRPSNLWKRYSPASQPILLALARNDERRVHDLLIPYGRLAEYQKDKDRNSVRNYFKILERAEFAVARRPRAERR